MSDPKPVEQLSYQELRSSAFSTVCHMLVLTKGQIDPTDVVRLGYFFGVSDEIHGKLKAIEREREQQSQQH